MNSAESQNIPDNNSRRNETNRTNHHNNQRNRYNAPRSYQRTRQNKPNNTDEPKLEDDENYNNPIQIEQDTRVSKDQKNKIYNRRKFVSQSENQENVVSCICCLHELYTFVYYSCSHYVCLNCAIKMRVLCEKYDCPVCRQESKKVYCTKKMIESKDLNLKFESNSNENQKAGIFFDPEQSKEIQQEHDEILSNRCDICPTTLPPFRTFEELDYHIKKLHRRFYCELCLDNLKLFPYERKHYTREELAMHKRKGDKDDYSFKGHPLCEYCDSRFFDRDDLYRHLRRDHYYCHFCDTDGIEEYYRDYGHLRQHFLKSHHLCELDGCSENAEQTHEYVVFRTQLDFQAHKKQKHAKTKSEQKNMGKINIEFSLTNSARDRYQRQRQNNRRHDDSPEQDYRPTTRPESKLKVTEIDPQVLRESERQFEQDEKSRKEKEKIQKMKELYEKTVDNKSELIDESQSTAQAAVAVVEPTPVPSSSSMWRNVISSGPAPKLNRESEFPSLGGGAEAKSSFNSLSDIGASIAGPWNKKVTKQQMKIEVVKPPSRKEPAPPPVIEQDKPLKIEPVLEKLETSNKKSKKKKEKNKNEIENESVEIKQVKIEPPPGFAPTNLGPPPGFQNLKIQEKESYIKPDNYDQRNLDLKSSLFMMFGHYNHEEFDKFKQLSNDFRTGSINAVDYLQKCQRLLDLPQSSDAYKNAKNTELKETHVKFLDLVQEMLVLLPDVKKQQELYESLVNDMEKYSKFDSPLKTMSSTKWAKNKSDSPNFTNKLIQCQFCSQYFKNLEINFHQLEFHPKEFQNVKPSQTSWSSQKIETKIDDDFRAQVISPVKVVNLEEFPSLGSGGTGSTLSWGASVQSKQQQKQQQVKVEESKPKTIQDDFPALQSSIQINQENRFSAMPTPSLFQNPNSHLSILNKKKHRLMK